MNKPDVRGFFDEATFTVSYVVVDTGTRRAAIIDPVLDYDAASGHTATRSADSLVAFANEHELTVDWILETHVHADHLTAAPYIRGRLGGHIGIGEKVVTVQETFKPVFNLKNLATDGRQFDHLFAGNESFRLGEIDARVLYTPGHTPACVTYVFGDAAFVGDTLFMPDYGTARTDFPGGDAGLLYDSIRSILSLPEATRLFMCHDYKASGRDEYAWETTVREQRERNIHVNQTVSRDDFIRFREERDRNLAVPKLILPSIQVNLSAGELPRAEDNGVRYLKVPLNAL